MKRIFLAVVVLLCAAALCRAQSLGELARKEKERRDKLAEQTKVITNHEAERYKGGAVTTGKPETTATAEKEPGDKTPAPPKEGTDPAAAAKPPAAPDEPTDLQGRTESYWRAAFTDVRGRVKELENESNVLILRLNDMQNQFYREADGYRQQQVQRDINKTLYEQDQNKEKLAKAKAAVDDLEKEARKSGALPGWIQARP